MKCSIYISGRINGNHELANAIEIPGSSRRAAMFGSIYIDFPNKSLAYKALWCAYKSLRAEWECRRIPITGGIKYFKKSHLRYDASEARIIAGTNYLISLKDAA